ncbi:MAG TPA: bifunctional phosphopantothenoylcysteine decarboxylase/phosphopantothenate--cysteine ligase CoaBC [Candidatus Saccharimonadales bacterium]|nr:bifunctional phosphopantothenoylcysteine decarboxylase/phosphopantothenate--cysteine ligase CoaBC [Candidatus Saccharimonadales bacterium]
MKIVLGVTGGIAAYKACEIVRGLRKRGCSVTVALTRTASKFITPVTMRALSGNPVIRSLFGREAGEIQHVTLARECRLLLVAPATAHSLARLANGLADDFISTFALAVRCPVLIAPAMNPRMWDHPAVQHNVQVLAGRGYAFIGPDEGAMAEEDWGVGRLADPEAIVARVMELLGWRRSLEGRTVLVTAGPTREAIDAVRFLSNPSSGKMGFAIAAAAVRPGAHVILVSGPTELPDPEGVEMVRVTSAAQMREAVMQRVSGASIVVKTAAVADYTPGKPVAGKIKKDGGPLRLDLQPTADILAEIATLEGNRFLVGFAAETGDLVANARSKLMKKGLDLVVANDVSGGAAFGSDDGEVIILDRSGREVRLGRLPKPEIAERLLDIVEERLAA